MLYRGMDRAQLDIAYNNRSRRAAQEGASTVSECFFAARLITPGDDGSWHEAWERVADINSARLTHIPLSHAKDKISSLVHLSPVRYGTMWARKPSLFSRWIDARG